MTGVLSSPSPSANSAGRCGKVVATELKGHTRLSVSDGALLAIPLLEVRHDRVHEDEDHVRARTVGYAVYSAPICRSVWRLGVRVSRCHAAPVVRVLGVQRFAGTVGLFL